MNQTVNNPRLSNFRIKTNGTWIDPDISIPSIECFSSLDADARAVLIITQGDYGFMQLLEVTAKLFKPGIALAIEAGYEGQYNIIFSGSVVEQRLVVKETNQVSVVIECRGPVVQAGGQPPVALELRYGTDILSLDQSWMGDHDRLMAPGRVSFPGSHLAVPGKALKLSDLGNQFGGNSFIASVHHRIENLVWTTFAGLGTAKE